MSSLSSLRCQGRHVFSIFLEMLGKTCLPCLPRDVGEDNWGCWGRQLEMLGKTGTLGKTLKAIGEDIKKDGDDTGEVRDDGEDIRNDREDIGRSGKMRKTCLPQHLRQRQGRLDFSNISRKIGKTWLP